MLCSPRESVRHNKPLIEGLWESGYSSDIKRRVLLRVQLVMHWTSMAQPMEANVSLMWPVRV